MQTESSLTGMGFTSGRPRDARFGSWLFWRVNLNLTLGVHPEDLAENAPCT